MDQINVREKQEDVVREALNKHSKVIFNGDSYNLENQEMLTKKGLSNIPFGMEAIHHLRTEKNLDLFKKISGIPP